MCTSTLFIFLLLLINASLFYILRKSCDDNFVLYESFRAEKSAILESGFLIQIHYSFSSLFLFLNTRHKLLCPLEMEDSRRVTYIHHSNYLSYQAYTLGAYPRYGMGGMGYGMGGMGYGMGGMGYGMGGMMGGYGMFFWKQYIYAINQHV